MAITARSIGGFIGTSLYTSILHSRLIPLFKAPAPVQDIPLIIEALLLRNKALLQDISPKLLRVAEQGINWLTHIHSGLRISSPLLLALTGTFFVAFSRNADNQMTRQVDAKLLDGTHIKDRNDTGAHFMERS
jgi:hypothetical protein